jgi:hypothetical protein
MKRYILAILVIAAVASCSTPGRITGRPDPTAATSGTLGSSKATDGLIPLKDKPYPKPDPDSTIHR